MDSAAILPHPSRPVDHIRPRVQNVIDEFVRHQRRRLDAMDPEVLTLVDAGADLLNGGKRLRATFCYWGWRSSGGAADDAAVITAAAALELFHASALVHDDMIDGSDTRRGAPSVHRHFAERHRGAGWQGSPDEFGSAAAVLLGDLLLGWSDELFNSAEFSEDALRRGRAVFDRMRTEVGGGQFLDVLEQASGASRPQGQAQRALTVVRYKSARYSVENPLLIGARLAGADHDTLEPYRRYGAALGEAFQLRDDILGVFGDPAHTGKPTGDDLREGKRTVLVAYALERADAEQTATMNRLLGDPALDVDGVERLRDILVETSALTRVEQLVSDLVTTARSALDDADASPDGREALSTLVDLATDRAH